MSRIHLPVEDCYLLLTPRFSTLAPGWQGIALGLMLLLPVGLVIWLYRWEWKLIKPKTAVFLLLARLILLFLLWFVAALQPIVARNQEKKAPSRVLVAVDLSASMDVRDVQRPVQDKLDLAKALHLEAGSLEQVSAQVDRMTRRDIVTRILTPDGLDWIARLEKNHHVDMVGFDETIVSFAELNDLPPHLANGNRSMATDLHLPLAQALAPALASDGPLLGLVMFTDGRHNSGPSPLAKAKELGSSKIPIYPVLIGAKEPPPDIAVLEVKAPAHVFKDADIQIASRIKISAMPAGDILVELYRNGNATDQSQMIHHDGKDQTVPMLFHLRMEEIGSQALQVKAQARASLEVSLENNARTSLVRVAQDKARVLLIDGAARWEYHYLAGALLRDPAMNIDQVVFSQPRTGDLPEEKLAALGHPRIALPAASVGPDDPLNVYTCIVFGDVPAAHLPLEDRRRLERYVSERGGTLILMAGKNYFPSEYLGASTAGDDPLVKMLPFTNPAVQRNAAGFRLALTAEGKITSFMQLEPTPETNAKRFAEFPQHFWGLVGKAKPGATVLATPASTTASTTPAEQAGLIVEQNYGLGRVLFIGIDSTWRWRYRNGDTYHHRFWGQVMRWATTDALLPGGNRFERSGSHDDMFDLSTDENLLRALAEESKGRLFTAQNVEDLLDLFARQVTKQKTQEELRVWQDAPLVWWFFCVVIGLLTVEWIVRKWAGLP